MTGLEAADRADIFIPHSLTESLVDLGEMRMNYATVGTPDLPALLLIPGQSESWWGYEATLPLLAEHFQAYAVDLRGQGRSTWTPGRYTLDNMGNDLVRFIDLVIGRPTIVSGLSSGGVLSAWLSAYAKPGQVRGALWEDPPLFASELNPVYGPAIRQCIGPVFALYSKWLGDQWSIGNWEGLQAAAPRELPAWIAMLLDPMLSGGNTAGPPQNLKEYDPEWGRAFWSGTVAASCDHARMLSSVKVPVLFTHHFRHIAEETGFLMGAISDLQAARARELVAAAGQPFEYRSFPEMPHSMHGADPKRFVQTLVEWATTLPPGSA
jgi:pimeloyl-ACP methyl ester carboxylesterase